jgi:DNA-binding transcriptional LysR family regulator
VFPNALRNNLTPAHTATRPQIKHMVRRLDDIEIMLDHHDRGSSVLRITTLTGAGLLSSSLGRFHTAVQ